MAKPTLLSACLLAFSVVAAAQASTDKDLFIFNLDAPVITVGLQVDYVLRDDSGRPQPASIERQMISVPWSKSAVTIGTAFEGKPAKTLQAIAFFPGCQFETLTLGLTAGVRQHNFQCKMLSTTRLLGRVTFSQFAGKKIEVSAFYYPLWAGQFFGAPAPPSLPPFILGRANLEADGSFSFDLPDFARDPLWDSLSHNASITFALIDLSNGMALAELSAPPDLSLGSGLKVAASYPSVIEFGLR